MRKLSFLIITVIMFSCILCFIGKPVKTKDPVTFAVMNVFMPAVAYADSDTVHIPKPDPPPIK